MNLTLNTSTTATSILAGAQSTTACGIYDNSTYGSYTIYGRDDYITVPSHYPYGGLTSIPNGHTSYSPSSMLVSGLLYSMLIERLDPRKIVSVAKAAGASLELCIEYVYWAFNLTTERNIPEIDEYLNKVMCKLISTSVSWYPSPRSLLELTKYNVKVIDDNVYIERYYNSIKTTMGEREALDICKVQAPSRYLEMCANSSVDEDTI